MPAENPPTIFRSPDNIEWKFIQTFDNFDEMDKFRRKNYTHAKTWAENSWQKTRLYCYRRFKHNCPFMLLAMMSTKQEYHVYGHGQHEHNNKHPSPKQKVRRKK
jgi:hypothetical protein